VQRGPILVTLRARFFALAHARLSFDAPEALTHPDVIPRLDDDDADPELIVAIGAMRPIRTAAVLVPIISPSATRRVWYPSANYAAHSCSLVAP